jgi:hypothetical protein
MPGGSVVIFRIAGRHMRRGGTVVIEPLGWRNF